LTSRAQAGSTRPNFFKSSQSIKAFMNFKTMKTAALAALPAIAAAAVTLLWTPAHAAIIISEVAPWSSGNSPVAADWFELTNTGSTSVNISGTGIGLGTAGDAVNIFNAAGALVRKRVA
jgi:hypothetical protein